MAHAAQDQAAASGGVGLGDYQIHPEHPLPNLSAGRNAAYRATSRERPDGAFFALVCDPASLPRIDVLPAVRKAASATLVTPLDWQVIDWPPSGRCNLTVVFERPGDGRFVGSIGESFAPLGEDAVTRDYLQPLASALRALATAGIVHGAVNPTNIMFRESPLRPALLAEFVRNAHAASHTATRPFWFAGRSYCVPRALAYALAGNVEPAAPAVRGSDFEIWAQRAMGDEIGMILIKAAQSETDDGGSADQRAAALVSRICIAL